MPNCVNMCFNCAICYCCCLWFVFQLYAYTFHRSVFWKHFRPHCHTMTELLHIRHFYKSTLQIVIGAFFFLLLSNSIFFSYSIASDEIEIVILFKGIAHYEYYAHILNFTDIIACCLNWTREESEIYWNKLCDKFRCPSVWHISALLDSGDNGMNDEISYAWWMMKLFCGTE